MQILKIFNTFINVSILIILQKIAFAESHPRFGEKFCNDPDYFCFNVKAHESWDSLFPDAEIRDLVKRLNRMNIALSKEIILAVPKYIERLSVYDIAPFPRHIDTNGEKIIFINQQELAWGAYDEEGELIWWGPVSTGSLQCVGVYGGCNTPVGTFRIIRKQDFDCRSSTFPRRPDGNSGGAKMPFCMHFFRGYALHGSEDVPGFRTSHGCIRMFTEDARWLNEEFIDLPGFGMKGTRVVVD